MIRSVNLYVLCDDLAPYGSLELAQHGVSYFINIKYDGEERNLIFDTCSSYDVVKHNASLMGVDLKKADAVVISHCHYDHTGGLRDLLREVDVPVFAHPSIFRENFRKPYRYTGIPREHLAELKGRSNFVLVREPLEIFEGVWTSGEVPRENSLEVIEDLYTVQEGKIVKDQMIDDTSLYIDLGGSAFLVSGCSHAGIVNIRNYGERLLGKSVKHIVGGLHLLNASEERVSFTIKNLSGINLHLGHCTGERVVTRLMDVYGSSVKRIYSGYRLSVSSQV